MKTDNYNPYKFILFIPLAILAALVYFLISSWQTLNNTTIIILIFIIFLTITFLGYHISRDHPLRGMMHERGEVEDIIQKIIERSEGPISDGDLLMLKHKTQQIYNTTYWRGERAMRLKIMMDEYLKNSGQRNQNNH